MIRYDMACKFCNNFATLRIQSAEDEFGVYSNSVYSCREHFGWLERETMKEEFQVVTLSILGFNFEGIAIKDLDWEVI